MKTEILEIITQHKFDHISSEQAVSELLDLFAVSSRKADQTAHQQGKENPVHRPFAEGRSDDTNRPEPKPSFVVEKQRLLHTCNIQATSR